jgi:hypothetical protein
MAPGREPEAISFVFKNLSDKPFIINILQNSPPLNQAE